MAVHKNLPIADSHFAHAWEYADETARNSASGFTSAEVGKLARQLDNNSLWMLTSTTPTWLEITSVAGGVNEIIKGASAPGDTSKYWLDTNDTPASLKYHDGSSWTKVAAEGSGSGSGAINEIDIRPDQFRLDDVATGADRGVVWNMLDAVDFDPDNDGAIWFSFKFPSGWDDTQDINLTLEYSCNGNDQGKTIVLNTQAWALDTGDTPNQSSPEASNIDNIGTSSSNIDTLSEITLINGKVPASILSATTNTIAIKLTRDANNASDNYTGTFQLISVLAKQ